MRCGPSPTPTGQSGRLAPHRRDRRRRALRRAGQRARPRGGLRGNSVYFPDRVVPMLPEALSNGLCSLVPGEDRACHAVHLWVDAQGRKRRHRFERAIMRSAARLTYEAGPGGARRRRKSWRSARSGSTRFTARLPRSTGAHRARRARARPRRISRRARRRQAPVAVEPRKRLDSHRLIEEFMILANVAAAEELEARRRPCVYRVHDAPLPERLDALRQALARSRRAGPFGPRQRARSSGRSCSIGCWRGPPAGPKRR
jgi:ribonuclease R